MCEARCVATYEGLHPAMHTWWQVGVRVSKWYVFPWIPVGQSKYLSRREVSHCISEFPTTFRNAVLTNPSNVMRIMRIIYRPDAGKGRSHNKSTHPLIKQYPSRSRLTLDGTGSIWQSDLWWFMAHRNWKQKQEKPELLEQWLSLSKLCEQPADTQQRGKIGL